MTGKLLRMKPIFQEKIWGGNRLHTIFNYDIPSDATGECWAISGHAGHRHYRILMIYFEEVSYEY